LEGHWSTHEFQTTNSSRRLEIIKPADARADYGYYKKEIIMIHDWRGWSDSQPSQFCPPPPWEWASRCWVEGLADKSSSSPYHEWFRPLPGEIGPCKPARIFVATSGEMKIQNHCSMARIEEKLYSLRYTDSTILAKENRDKQQPLGLQIEY
jgi:hypothetical protein